MSCGPSGLQKRPGCYCFEAASSEDQQRLPYSVWDVWFCNEEQRDQFKQFNCTGIELLFTSPYLCWISSSGHGSTTLHLPHLPANFWGVPARVGQANNMMKRSTSGTYSLSPSLSPSLSLSLSLHVHVCVYMYIVYLDISTYMYRDRLIDTSIDR